MPSPIASARNSAADIPTADEAGLPGFHMTLWSGMWVPKGTPKEIVARLNAAAVEALNDPSVRKQLKIWACRCRPRISSRPKRWAPGRRPRSQNGGR